MIALPVRHLRSWEEYFDPDPEDLASMLAKPFTRIVGADGRDIVWAHDCFEFAPGDAETIVAALNRADKLEALVDAVTDHMNMPGDGWQKIVKAWEDCV